MNKEEVANFIGDLIFPIEPLVFAGDGKIYQNEFLKAMDSDDPLNCLEIEVNYMSAFIGNSNLHELLDILMFFLTNRPTEYINNLATRRKEDWDYYVNLIISKIGNIIPEVTIDRLENLLRKNGEQRRDIIGILLHIENCYSYNTLCKIRDQYKDLTEAEIEMIKGAEFKK